MDIKITTVAATYCQINRGHKLLAPILQYEKEYWRQGRYKKERKVYSKSLIFTNNGSRYTLYGFKDKIISYCEQNDIKIQWIDVDLQIKCVTTPKIDGIEFRDYQLRLMQSAINVQRGVIKAPTGCISGDTHININRAKKGSYVTIRHLYLKYHGKSGQTNGPAFDECIVTKVRSFKHDKNKILLHEIKDVVYSGKKELYLLELDNNCCIKATKDHLFLTSKGWKKLLYLTKFDNIMVDTLKATKNNKSKQKKVPDNVVGRLWYHPYARKIKSGSYAIGWDKVVEYHRAVYESYINQISLNEYKKILRNNTVVIKKLKFVNPNKYHIHHKDGNHNNNDVLNLEKILITTHKQLHSDYSYFGQGNPQFSKVKSITFVGIEDTYDIICKDPYRNFVANGIVVHNSGKTIIILGIMSTIPKEHNILFLCHTNTLLQQIHSKLIECGFPSDTIGVFGGGKKEIGRITLATIQSYVKVHTKYIDYYHAVFIDECHHISSFTGSYAKVLGSILAPFRIGVTATLPQHTENKLALEGYVGPLIDDLTIIDAQKKAILAKPKIVFRKMPHNHNIREQYKYAEVYKLGVTENKTRNKAIIEIAKQHTDKGETVLIIVRHIEHGEILTNMAKELHSFIIHFVRGATEGDDREQIRELLISKKIKCVVATAVWKEGVDIPSLNILINGAGGKSEIATLQTVGRGLRKTKDKEDIIIYDFFDSSHPYLISHFGERVCLYMDMDWM